MWVDWLILVVVGLGLCAIMHFTIPATGSQKRRANYMETELKKHRGGPEQAKLYYQSLTIQMLILGIVALFFLILIRL